jgi:hypothetical protein
MLSFLKSLGIIEISLFQLIFYGLFWISNQYLAILLTAIIVPILIMLLVISIVAEILERSKVPKSYFTFMIISILIPLLVGIFFYKTNDGIFDWMQ